jgi:hypothetical protein
MPHINRPDSALTPEELAARKARRRANWRRYDKAHRDQRREKAAIYDASPARDRKRHATKMDHGRFASFDGEGISVGPVITLPTGGAPGHPHTVQAHHYNMMQIHVDGKFWTAEPPRNKHYYSFFECCDFIANAMNEIGDVTALVGYGLSYDYTHIMKSLTREQALEMRKPRKFGQGVKIYNSDRVLYLVDYFERKSLKVQIYKGGRFWDDEKKCKIKPDAQFLLWDTIAFFQSAFVKTCEVWIPDFPDLELIKTMKAKRGDFANVSHDLIEQYNKAEVVALSLVMGRLWEALRHEAVDLQLKRWDGAGAVAMAILKKFGVKKHLQNTREDFPGVFQAARHAYVGGRIEQMKCGYKPPSRSHTVYQFDIASAYPAAMVHLPSLAGGHWTHGEGSPPPGFSVVRVRWNLPHNAPFYPFPFRQKSGGVCYPRNGETWVWLPEYEAGLKWAERFRGSDRNPAYIEPLEFYHFIPASDKKPFSFIYDLYAQRAALKKAGETDPSAAAAQIILKLGLNSLYGKCCQQVGSHYDEDGELKTPPFFQLEYAGFITSYTRATLLTAALNAPMEIVSFATDGIISEVDLKLPLGKALGDWGVETCAGVLYAQSGVYHLIKHDGKIVSYTRGISKDGGKSGDALIDNVCALWAVSNARVYEARPQMISFGTALMQSQLWEYRGCFHQVIKQMRFNGASNKRDGVNVPLPSLVRRLAPTAPVNHADQTIAFPMSHLYKMAWKDEAIDAGEWDMDEFH